jgi:hypothetical protein
MKNEEVRMKNHIAPGVIVHSDFFILQFLGESRNLVE